MKLMTYRNYYFALSLAIIIPGLITLALFGLRPAIDFTGGSLWEITLNRGAVDATAGTDFSPIAAAEVKDVVAQTYHVTSVQSSGSDRFIIRGETIDQSQKVVAQANLEEKWGGLQELRFESVGPTIGNETLVKMMTAVGVVAVFITLYVWRQFRELKYGVSAVLAMFHDSLILLGSFSILGYLYGVEVDVLFVTAVLTTLSFSVHDTIVVYDRIRELSRKHGNFDFETIVNAAVLETLGRSVNNSITIIIMLVSLSLLGGDTIRWFALALLIGSITGTYSSTFTAAPLLLLWDQIFKKK